jgi:metal-responsive CopG/Arc/MetJ family transcriptional regulator
MRRRSEVVTFKADDALLDSMKGIRNRSEFIRSAILNALENACPLCKGTGVLSPTQKVHWDAFSQRHAVQECSDCHELHLICSAETKR